MKKVLVLTVLILFVVGCSRTPLDRLKNYEPDPNKPYITDEDRVYWENAAKKGTSDFKEAVDFCKGKSQENPICGQFITELNYQCEQEKKYIDHGFSGIEERHPPKEHCDELNF